MNIYVSTVLSTDNLHQADWNLIKSAFLISLLAVKSLNVKAVVKSSFERECISIATCICESNGD